MIGRDSYRFVREKAIAKVFLVGVLFNISLLVVRNVHKKKKKKKKKRGEIG
jgi:Sec-independent protein secretion pathway component TatC